MSFFIYLDLTQGATTTLLLEVFRELLRELGQERPGTEFHAEALWSKVQACLKHEEASKEGRELVEILTKIQPAYMLASAVPFSFDPHESLRRQRLWELSEGLVIREQEWPGPCVDEMVLAFIKSTVSTFGPCQEGNVVKAVQKTLEGQTCTALICSLSPLESSTVFYTRIEAQLFQYRPSSQLLLELQQKGAQGLRLQHSLEGETPQTFLYAYVPSSASREVIRGLFASGEVKEVGSSPAEHHTLYHQEVAVPYGKGQKVQICRLDTFLYEGTIVRAEAKEQDLQHISRLTGFSQEAIRADVLAAWRKCS